MDISSNDIYYIRSNLLAFKYIEEPKRYGHTCIVQIKAAEGKERHLARSGNDIFNTWQGSLLISIRVLCTFEFERHRTSSSLTKAKSQ